MTGVVACRDGRLMIDGALDFETVPQIDLDAVFDTSDDEIVVSLAQVTQTDSAGLAMLLELTRRALLRDRRVVLLDVPAQLRSLMEISGVEALLNTGAAPR